MSNEQYKKYVSLAVVVLVTLFIAKIFNLTVPLNITSTTATRSSELAVTGEGKVDVVPDTAYVNLGITVTNVKTADEANKQITKINNQIIAAVTKLGVKKQDIKTENYSVYPEYDYNEPVVRDKEKISGYSGSADVRIKVKDTKLISRIIEEGTNAGANEVRGTTFEVGDPAKFREEARNKAIENAKEQAKKLADSLGIRLGKIVNIVESSGDRPIPIYKGGVERMTAEGDSMAPEIEPGSQTITSAVTLYFERK
jgi:hypothetical protein